MSQDLFGSFDATGEQGDSEPLFGTPVEFSGVSGGGSSTDSPLPARQQQPIVQPSQTSFPCPECKKTLKTHQGFLRHQAAHKIKDANARRPDADHFTAVVYDVMTKIVDEMLAEPSYGDLSDPKLQFLNELKSKSESMEWSYFVAAISDPIISFVCEKTKVMPLNQYEDAHRELNILLNETETISTLVEQLMLICDAEISQPLARRIIFRLSFKLLDKFISFTANEMMPAETREQSSLEFEMSDVEEKAFLHSLGNIFRTFVKKGSRGPSRLSHSSSDCIKENFVICQQHISTEQFLLEDNWFSGDEGCIALSANASGFFKIVERICRESVTVKKLTTTDVILDKILGNVEALNLWFFLTNSYFSEENSLQFMKDLVSAYVSESMRLEESRKIRNEEKSIRETQVALRAHLGRNYKEKDD